MSAAARAAALLSLVLAAAAQEQARPAGRPTSRPGLAPSRPSSLPVPALPDDGGRETLTVARVREVISFLASDALGGRDTPSFGQDEAMHFLAGRFARARLASVLGGGYLHRYQEAGFSFDSAALRVAVTRPDGSDLPLAAVREVRLWRGGKEIDGEFEVLRADVASEDARALRRRLRGTRPVLLEVAEDSPLWLEAVGSRDVLVAGSEPPWLLVRRGVLPAGEAPLRAKLTVPAAAKKTLVLHNVVACIPGSEKPDEIVLFSAHYDHVGMDLPVAGDSIRNGADDDATGTTAVLLLAEAFARRKQRLPRTLVFACFSGEERGMRGSRAFAADPPFPLANVVANLNLEMLGRPDDCGERRAWITGADLSDFAEVAAAALARAGIECTDHPQAAMLFFGSDNISLARRGVVAHSLSAGSLHSDYHQPSDEVERLDLDHLTAVLRGLYEAGVEFATRTDRPQWNEKGLAAIREGSRRR